MMYHVTIGGRTFQVELGDSGITVDGEAHDVDFARIDGEPVHSLLLGGASHRVSALRVAKETWDLHLSGRRIRADVVDERTRVIREITAAAGGGASGPRPIVAPMPGMVVRIDVEVGDTVSAGQGVVIVEAMKMENELKAAADGVVSRILVSEGEAVEKDQLLVDLEPLPKDDEDE